MDDLNLTKLDLDLDSDSNRLSSWLWQHTDGVVRDAPINGTEAGLTVTNTSLANTRQLTENNAGGHFGMTAYQNISFLVSIKWSINSRLNQYNHQFTEILRFLFRSSKFTPGGLPITVLKLLQRSFKLIATTTSYFRVRLISLITSTSEKFRCPLTLFNVDDAKKHLFIYVISAISWIPGENVNVQYFLRNVRTSLFNWNNRRYRSWCSVPRTSKVQRTFCHRCFYFLIHDYFRLVQTGHLCLHHQVQ